jgi:hypothetical protein
MLSPVTGVAGPVTGEPRPVPRTSLRTADRTGDHAGAAIRPVPPGGPARVAPESGRSPAGRVAGRGRTGIRTLRPPARDPGG